MSYILDALRRADAERERGSVPGLHTQLQPARDDGDAAPRHAVPPWLGFAAGALVVVAALAAWRFIGHDEPAPPVVVAQSPGPAATVMQSPAPAIQPAAPLATTSAQTGNVASSPSPASPAAAHAAAPISPALEQGMARAPAVPPAMAPAPRTSARVHAAVSHPAQRPREGVADSLPSASSLPATAAAPTSPAVPSPARSLAPSTLPAGKAEAPASDAARIYAQSELPDNIRRDLPNLTVGGSIYSDNAASRFLIINGQIYHEGDKVAPELVLEQIKLKNAVLRFKGYRYALRF